MAATKFKYNGSLKKYKSADTTLPGSISDMAFPTAYNAVNSKEWIESHNFD